MINLQVLDFGLLLYRPPKTMPIPKTGKKALCRTHREASTGPLAEH